MTTSCFVSQDGRFVRELGERVVLGGVDAHARAVARDGPEGTRPRGAAGGCAKVQILRQFVPAAMSR